MSDLLVDAPRLRDASTRITGGVQRLRFAQSWAAPADAVGSRQVSATLRSSSAQQSVRAELTADAVLRVGSTPAVAAQTFLRSDAGLARVL